MPETKIRALVCGGRTFYDYHRVIDVLHKFPLACIIHGGAKGADSLAGKYAAEFGIPVEVYPANWEEYGRSAGQIRNQEMLSKGKPDVVIAFPGGRGTANMILIARRAKVPLEIITEQFFSSKETTCF